MAAKRSEMEGNQDYIRRKAYIEDQSAQRQKELMEEIRHLQEKLAKLDTMNLQEVLSDLNPNEEDPFWSPALPPYEPKNYLAKIQNSKNFNLLKYLVRNGYIDENYAAYVSYFYPHSLTAQDRNFFCPSRTAPPWSITTIWINHMPYWNAWRKRISFVGRCGISTCCLIF